MTQSINSRPMRELTISMLPSTESHSTQELTIADLLTILKRRRSFIVLSTLVLCFVRDSRLHLHDAEIQGNRRDTSCQAKLG